MQAKLTKLFAVDGVIEILPNISSA